MRSIYSVLSSFPCGLGLQELGMTYSLLRVSAASALGLMKSFPISFWDILAKHCPCSLCNATPQAPGL